MDPEEKEAERKETGVPEGAFQDAVESAAREDDGVREPLPDEAVAEAGAGDGPADAASPDDAEDDDGEAYDEPDGAAPEGRAPQARWREEAPPPGALTVPPPAADHPQGGEARPGEPGVRPQRLQQRRRRGRGGRGGAQHHHPQGRGHGGDHRAGHPDNGGGGPRGGQTAEPPASQNIGGPGPGPSAPKASTGRRPVKREILSNAGFEETRIAIIEDGRLAELLWERRSAESIVGNIYKGVVENVLPGISSAFVNIGFEKNAYLYISDVLGGRGAPIDQLLKKGQDIIVQVAKEAIGTKGMKVTMDVSLPGRFLMFTPFQKHVGISKNIQEPDERGRLSAIVDKLVAEHLGGRGVVVRTEAEEARVIDLEREVKYLVGTWNSIQAKHDSQPAPVLLHEDLDLNLQVARDILSDEVYVYLVDNKDGYKGILEFVKGFAPDLAGKVRLYEGKTPIFKAFDIEPDIEKLRETKVVLPNGGSIIIQEAESLCAIDVNTGRFTGSKSQEETVTQTNIEAASEIAHQLRLRNIGGIVVVDFIDMRKASNRNKVMEAFSSAVRRDRAKIRILPITRLGLIEMTRERKRESTLSLITDECPQCKGTGHVLSSETVRIRIQREVREMTAGRPGGQIRIVLHPALGDVLRSQQAKIEKNVQRSVKIQNDPQLKWEDYRIILE